MLYNNIYICLVQPRGSNSDHVFWSPLVRSSRLGSSRSVEKACTQFLENHRKSGGLMGFNQQNGDFNGINPLVILDTNRNGDEKPIEMVVKNH